MKSRILATVLCAGLLGLSVSGARAIETVNWAADSALDGMGTGTLFGSITVDYTTEVGVGNASVTVANNWDVSLATDGAVGSGASNLTGGVFSTTAASSPQTLSFSSSLLNPILFFNFGDANTSLDFGTLSLTLLDSNNAQLTGSVVTFVGSSNGFDDGIAVRANGTFSSIAFSYLTTTPPTHDSVAFTVAAVPEPAYYQMSALLGLGGLGFWRMRRRRK